MEPETPEELLKYVNMLVEVTTTTGTTRQGIVLTIDPESQMIVLLDKDTTNKIYLLNGDNIKSKTVLESSLDFEIKTKDYLSTLAKKNTPNDNNILCSKLSNWLLKNKYKTINENGILKISNELIIIPPYGIEQCISNNKQLLQEVRNCIESMSDKKNEG